MKSSRFNPFNIRFFFLFLRRGVYVMGMLNSLTTAFLVVVCLGLVGCDNETEFSEVPFSAADKTEIRPVRTNVFADHPIDLASVEKKLNDAMATEVLVVQSWLRNAACYERRGRKVCKSARSRTFISRVGAMKLVPAGDGLAAIYPLRAVFSASGSGAAKDVREGVTEHFFVRIALKVGLDKEWQPTVSLGETSIVNAPKKIELLGREVKFKKALNRKLFRVARRLPPILSRKLNGLSFQALAQKSWRRLYDPIQISHAPEIWLRGRPVSLSFGGFGNDGTRLTSRIAIQTLLTTSFGERPVPLMPKPMPALIEGKSVVQKSFVNFNLPVSYDELHPAIEDALHIDGTNIGEKGNEIFVDARKAEIYPSGHYMAVQLNVNADVADEWFDRNGRLYFTASPWFDAKKIALTFDNVAITQPKTNPKFFKDGRFLFNNAPYVKRLSRAINIPLNARFERLMTSANQMMNQKLGNGLWLRGMFNEISVSSISPRDKSLELNLKLRGYLTFRSSPPPAVVPNDTKISSAALSDNN